MKFELNADYDGYVTITCSECPWDSQPLYYLHQANEAALGHTEHLPPLKPLTGPQVRQMMGSIFISGSSAAVRYST